MGDARCNFKMGSPVLLLAVLLLAVVVSVQGECTHTSCVSASEGVPQAQRAIMCCSLHHGRHCPPAL
jgi:hypothetical protein